MKIMIVEDLPKNKCSKCGSENLKLDGNMSLTNPPRYFSTCEDCGTINLLDSISTEKVSSIDYDDFIDMIRNSLNYKKVGE